MNQAQKIEFLKKRQARAKAEQKNQAELKKQIAELKHAIAKLKIETTEVDLTPLLKAVEAIKFPEVDLMPIIREIKSIKPKVTVNAPKPLVKQTLIKQDDIFDIYKAADTDESKDEEKYYGFVSSTGRWFILREMGNDYKTFKYAVGLSRYLDSWQARVRLNYDYFHKVQL